MQKFTRPITREVELDTERLALTLDESGVTIRPVGSRKPPHTCSWASLLCHLARQEAEPTAEALTAALAWLRTTKVAPKPAESGNVPAPATEESTMLARTLAVFEGWLKDNRSRYYRNLNPGATATELAALGQFLDQPVPDDLRTLLSWHNGQGDDFAGALEGSWMLLPVARIIAAKQELDAGATSSTPTGWQPEWIPFLDDDSGNYVCMDTSQPDGPVREFWLGNSDHPVVAPSLAAWFAKLLAGIERGEYVEDTERGRFLKRPG